MTSGSGTVVIHEDEEKDIVDQDSDLIEWCQSNDLADIQHALTKKKYTLQVLKYLNDDDMEEVIKDLKQDNNIKLSVPQVLRFKAGVKKLQESPSSNSNKLAPRHVKAKKSHYTYSIDLNEFYSTTQTITIIGGSRVGKSSIKDVVMGRKFDENKFPTIRMNEQPELYIKKIKNKLKRSQSAPSPGNDITVKYHIWDCPGQKALEHIPPLYITGIYPYIYMFSI